MGFSYSLAEKEIRMVVSGYVLIYWITKLIINQYFS